METGAVYDRGLPLPAGAADEFFPRFRVSVGGFRLPGNFFIRQAYRRSKRSYVRASILRTRQRHSIRASGIESVEQQFERAMTLPAKRNFRSEQE